ncbi:MAG: hypothetical protein QNJ09_09880 [Paracoccaceae bacterium]|nr:hypothetical protein [Paracoccaceae bacterium]
MRSALSFVALALAVSFAAAAPARAEFETPVPSPGAPPEDKGGWSGALRVFFGSNSNTQYFNDFLNPAVEQSSLFSGVSGTLTYSQQVSSGWTVGVTASVEALNFHEGSNAPLWNSASDYSFYTAGIAVFARGQVSLNGQPATLSGTLSYRIEDAPDVRGVGSETLSADISLATKFRNGWDASVMAQIARQDFDTGFAGFDPASVRDGKYHALSATIGRAVPLAFVTRLSGTLGVDGYNADGNNWSYDGWFVKATADLYFAPRVQGSLSLSRAEKDYDGDFVSLGYITPPGRVDQTIDAVEFGLRYNRQRGQTLDASIRHERAGSNSGEFTGDRTIFSLGYTWVLQ